MKIRILAVGSKMPAWVQDGVSEYTKRFPRDFKVDILDIPLGLRSKNSDPRKAIEQEGQQMLALIDKKDWVVALEVKGKSWTTEMLAQNLENWQMDGRQLAVLIGGPDGLSESCRQRADLKWSLSALTLPHPIVRVMLAEQLYRAWTLTQNHPYHRA